MQLTLAHIGPNKSGKSPAQSLKAQYDALTRIYMERTATCFPCNDRAFASEPGFLDWIVSPKITNSRQAGRPSRTPALPVLLDGTRGRQLSSTDFAAWLGTRRDQGTQHIAFAIGPADGWSAAALELARQSSPGQPQLILSLGLITMSHDLARLVLAEQLYRACTILTGHPYHSGH